MAPHRHAFGACLLPTGTSKCRVHLPSHQIPQAISTGPISKDLSLWLHISRSISRGVHVGSFLHFTLIIFSSFCVLFLFPFLLLFFFTSDLHSLTPSRGVCQQPTSGSIRKAQMQTKPTQYANTHEHLFPGCASTCRAPAPRSVHTSEQTDDRPSHKKWAHPARS